MALPTYPFERRRFWIDAAEPAERPALPAVPAAPAPATVPSWQREELPISDGPRRFLIFAEREGAGARLAERLRRDGRRAIVASPGAAFAAAGPDAYEIAPGSAADWARLLAAAAPEDGSPLGVAHLGDAAGDPALLAPFASLLALGAALAGRPAGAVRVAALSAGAHDVTGAETLRPASATALGPVLALAGAPAGTARSVDLADWKPGWPRDR